jgi:hypothetical protein
MLGTVRRMNDPEVDEAALTAAKTLCFSGFPARSQVLALQILARVRNRNDTRLTAFTTQFLADTCFMMGHYEAGIGFGREACTLFAELNDPANEAHAASNLASLFASIGEQAAISEALTALDLIETSGDPSDIIWGH